MKIVDSQVHVWYPNLPEHPWLPPSPESIPPHRDRLSFVAEDLLAEMRAAGVDRAILVPPVWVGYSNDKVLEAARRYPDRLAVMGRLGLELPESRGKIATWKQQPGMLGVRLFSVRSNTPGWLEDGNADWFWPAAEKAGLGVMVYASGNLPSVKKVAERYPGLKLVIDHMAIPRGVKDDAAFAHMDELCAFARFPNVAVKVGALPCYSTEPYPHPKLHKYVRRAYDAFGPKRLFWAADVTRLPCSYALAKTMITEEMKWLTIGDLEWIMGRGVCEWLGWPLSD